MGQEAKPVDFGRDIQPIFAKACFRCHGPDEAEGGLRLDSRTGAFAETDSGDHAIVAGDVKASVLLDRITSGDEGQRMPPEGKPLSKNQIDLIRRWISAGATWKGHWAYEAVKRPEPPKVKNQAWVHNPIDAFVLRDLELAEIKPAAEADKITLVRRAYYDLTGLPPSLQEVETFVADKSSKAYEKLIDRLLASPHYGERWARHWLDLVRFAETNSFERDGIKPHAWRYRDYVIRSLNNDKPYDQFIREQLAGDELPKVTADSIIATGYYRLGIWDDEPGDRLQARYDGLDDIVSTTAQVFLGLTVGCARCHDHKIDPIPQKDYYRMLSFFHNITPMGKSGRNIERRINASDDQGEYDRRVQALADKKNNIQSQLTKIENDFRIEYEQPLSDSSGKLVQADMDDLQYRFYRDSWTQLPNFSEMKHEDEGKLPQQLFDISPATRRNSFGFVFEGILKVPSEGEYTFFLDSDDGSRLLIDGKKIAELDGIHGVGNVQQAKVRLKKGRLSIKLEYFQGQSERGLHVAWAGPGFSKRWLSAREAKTIQIHDLIKRQGARVLGKIRFAEYRELKKTLDKLKQTKIETDLALCVTEHGRSAPETFVLMRGNAHVKGDKVEPGFLSILKPPQPQFKQLAKGVKSSGRRLALANWIASPNNQMTSRVMVNRIWQFHFGRGIVRSPNNFGGLGIAPTHPELLDWLARRFVAEGWSMKTMHKLIMMSNTYRMSSQASRDNLAKDPTNNLFWRFEMRRLSAEEIRDSIHAVTGTLNRQMFGKGFYPEISREVMQGQSKPGDGWGKSTADQQSRRSIYIHVKRSLLTPILSSFDFPDPDGSCAIRFETTQPTQALGMINGKFLNDQAKLLAVRLRKEAGDKVSDQVKLALRLATSRQPDATSLRDGVHLIESLTSQDDISPEQALNYYCLVVLNLNEFIYLD